MSIPALRIARAAQGLSPTQKLVLYVLADMADDEGECWPSIAALEAASALSDRAIQSALKGARVAGYLQIQPGGGRGRTTLFRVVNPEASSSFPEAPSGNTGAENPEAPSETPKLTTETPKQVRETPNDVHPEALKKQKEKKEGGVRRADPGEGPNPHGTRLPADWQPGAIEVEFARSQGLDPKAVAERFRDFWHGKAGQGGRKLNWTATWRNWCRDDVERAKRRGGSPSGRPRHKTAAELEAELDARCGFAFDADPEPRHVVSERLN